MTIIAWDGKTLAADRMGTDVGWGFQTTKIMRLADGRLAAISGTDYVSREILDWVCREPIERGTFPAPRDKDHWASVCVFEQGKPVAVYGHGPQPTVYEEPFFAAGSGRDYALAVMYLGKGAREAVEVASHFDVNCGLGIDTLQFDERST